MKILWHILDKVAFPSSIIIAIDTFFKEVDLSLLQNIDGVWSDVVRGIGILILAIMAGIKLETLWHNWHMNKIKRDEAELNLEKKRKESGIEEPDVKKNEELILTVLP